MRSSPPHSQEQTTTSSSGRVGSSVTLWSRPGRRNAGRSGSRNFFPAGRSLTINADAQLVLRGGAGIITNWDTTWGIHGGGELVVKDQGFTWESGVIGVKYVSLSNTSFYVVRNVQQWLSDYIYVGVDENDLATTGAKLYFGNGGESGDLNTNVQLDTSDIFVYGGNDLYFSQFAGADHKGGITNGRNLKVYGSLNRTVVGNGVAVQIGANVEIEGVGSTLVIGESCLLRISDPADTSPALNLKSGSTFSFKTNFSYLYASSGVVVRSGAKINVVPHEPALVSSQATLYGNLTVKAGGRVNVGDALASGNKIARLNLGTDEDFWDIFLEGGTLNFACEFSEMMHSSLIDAGRNVLFVEDTTTTILLDFYTVAGVGPPDNGWQPWKVLWGDEVLYENDESRWMVGDGNPNRWRGDVGISLGREAFFGEYYVLIA